MKSSSYLNDVFVNSELIFYLIGFIAIYIKSFLANSFRVK